MCPAAPRVNTGLDDSSPAFRQRPQRRLVTGEVRKRVQKEATIGQSDLGDGRGMTAEKLIEFGLERAAQERSELVDDFKLIDSKAQTASAVAGAFAAAAMIFVRNSAFQLSGLEAGLLALLLSMLVGAVACALIAMLVKSSPTPMAATDILNDIETILREGGNLSARLEGLQGDALRTSASANDGLRKNCKEKAGWLKTSQCLLFSACIVPIPLACAAIIRG